MGIENIIGKIIRLEDTRYRILCLYKSAYILCNMDISKISLIFYSANDIDCRIRNDEIEIVEEPSFVLDINSMSSNERAIFEKKQEIMQIITDEYGPTYMGLMGKHKKPIINDILSKYKVSKTRLWEWMRKYLQSGLNINSLADIRHYRYNRPKYNYKSKTGRPKKDNIASGVVMTPELESQFEEFLKYYKKGREKTFKNAYIGLIKKYYSQSIAPGDIGLTPLPISERPTYNQFYYYCKQHLTKDEIDIIKTSRQEQRNNKRLLIGSSRTDVHKPGWVVECDALEADFSIVSEKDPSQSIGRPIVYMMIDVYSSMIVAISAAFENNSYIGLSNLMLNLMEDKARFVQKYGIAFDSNLWASNFIPHEIRCDRGADFKSKKFAEICKRLGINLTLEPGATGSYKGMIEQSFHQFQSQIRPELENKGLITKRHDSNHHREAMLTLSDFTQVLISYVLMHNQKVIKDYPMSKDMYREPDFQPIPIKLWQYGCSKEGIPTPITDAQREQYIYDLMIEAKATISRKGLVYKNLTYINTKDQYLMDKMYKLKTKRESFTVRYDPRDVSKLYYMHDNKLYYAELNELIPGSTSFKGLTWAQYDEFYDAHKRIASDSKDYNILVDYNLNQIVTNVVSNAETPNLADDKNLRTARKTEKLEDNYSNRLSNQLEGEEPKTKLQDNTPISKKNNDDLDEYAPNDDFMSALDDFEDRMRGL